LLYGCGLRVSEPLNLRVRDVELWHDRLIIRSAKGGKDRMVAVPCACVSDLQEQMDTAKAIWHRDQHAKLPVALPHLLAKKYPHYQFNLQWAWLFPAANACRDPRSGHFVRWRLHEANIQRAVRRGCRALGISVLPHELRHAYATHCLNSGTNPRAIQQAMGHKNLETTMGYLHAEALSVASPLDAVLA
jgi:integrase